MKEIVFSVALTTEQTIILKKQKFTPPKPFVKLETAV
jgi:hypothetical protein